MESRFLALAGQVLVAGFPQGAPDRRLVSAIADRGLGGVILFKRNLGTPGDVAALLDSLVREAPRDLPLLTAVDQEGGRVARLGTPILSLPAMRKLGELDDEALTEAAGRRLGAHLRALGFSTDFAPVLDVDTNPANPVIGDRAFARDAAGVIRHGLAFARGLSASGVIACGKHFPGHGDTDLDSHLALPKLAHDRARLDTVELAPFRASRGTIPMLMSAHVVFESLDPEVPATLSRRVMTDLLRGELGYDGVVVSDDLEMKAVADRYGVEESAVRAIEAGCDALLVCSDVDALFRARDALAAHAAKSATFEARLTSAVERFVTLRRAFPPKPERDAASLARILDDEDTREFERALASRVSEKHG